MIDLSVLAQVVGDNPDKLHKFASRFVETTRAGLAEMDACAAGGDMARIRDLGHRIKSAARIVGALGMGELCERLEKMPPAAPELELAQARVLIARLWPLFEQISAIVARPSPAPPGQA